MVRDDCNVTIDPLIFQYVSSIVTIDPSLCYN